MDQFVDVPLGAFLNSVKFFGRHQRPGQSWVEYWCYRGSAHLFISISRILVSSRIGVHPAIPAVRSCLVSIFLLKAVPIENGRARLEQNSMMPNFPTLSPSLPVPAWRWRMFSWAKVRPWTLLAIVILLIHAVPFLLKHHSEWDEVYLRAADRLLNGGDIYRFEDGYSYPPFMAWLAIPFTALPTIVSRIIWFSINVGCLIGMWRIAWRLTGGGVLEGIQGTNLKEHLVCFVGIACSARYALNGIAHHQTDLVIGLLLIFGCWMFSRNRNLSAATCFGLAAAMKCTALLWVPYLLWR